jgi:hypothetical protein
MREIANWFPIRHQPLRSLLAATFGALIALHASLIAQAVQAAAFQQLQLRVVCNAALNRGIDRDHRIAGARQPRHRAPLRFAASAALLVCALPYAVLLVVSGLGKGLLQNLVFGEVKRRLIGGVRYLLGASSTSTQG